MRSASAASTNGQRATSRNPRVRMSSSAPGDEVRAESLSLELLGHLGVQQNDRAGLQAVHDLACDRVVEDELVAIQLWIVSDGDSRLGHAPSLAFSSSATLCWRGGPDADAAERARFLSRLSPLVLRAPKEDSFSSSFPLTADRRPMDALPLTAAVLHVPEEERALLSDTEILEFRCARCRYGISLTGPLPPCPMCHSHLWVHVDRDPS
jgi:hypothetical protein